MLENNEKSAELELAELLIATVAKKKRMSSAFEHCEFSGVDRIAIDPAVFDELVKTFIDSDYSDVNALACVIKMINDAKAEEKERVTRLIKDVKEYIDGHLAENITIEDIAARYHVSYFYLCHCFKSETGISANSYRTRKRIEKAVCDIAFTDRKITHIANDCGFNNPSYFAETFSKAVGCSPIAFRKKVSARCMHGFYDYEDILLASKLDYLFFDAPSARVADDSCVTRSTVHRPTEEFKFLHQPAIIEYEGVLYAAWYNSRRKELCGYTPVCGRKSTDGGKTWSEIEIWAHDPQEHVMYCPPAFGICDGKLYMLVNEMVAADHIHALDLYVLNRDTGKFQFIWSRPIPFKLNSNVVSLPNGKLMLTGRAGQLDRFPNIPAVLISDSGRIDGDWRMVKVAESGELPDGTQLVHPESSVMCRAGKLYMFSRNDRRRIPLVYISQDFGESWSDAFVHDIPYVSSNIFCGILSSGIHYIICNTDKHNRSRLSVYFADKNGKFSTKLVLFDREDSPHDGAEACHYPSACECDGKLYIISSLNYGWDVRGAALFTVDLEKLFG